ncbi:uncharacterized protein MONBRDRAFT_23080 [Monosiga brevicollis MX1]|uniref:tRNA (uracil-O(2)-)-methyltransferase n=1 Tax=Monosiga brevicollis TaxID=81824 RepID=A9UR49_MONBE|nr:uncharacterized protein MONBRDRAFT_23080 [Monosiga brevicollis MX1]EDQ91855.1 predicted protein [Monosiga brevicollis MX1]|eukprot:XP_001743141.1 hypothetical protein [Monosiga brevicollis MX1]
MATTTTTTTRSGGRSCVWARLITQPTEAPVEEESALEALDRYIHRPHLINRRIGGTETRYSANSLSPSQVVEKLRAADPEAGVPENFAALLELRRSCDLVVVHHELRATTATNPLSSYCEALVLDAASQRAWLCPLSNHPATFACVRLTWGKSTAEGQTADARGAVTYEVLLDSEAAEPARPCGSPPYTLLAQADVEAPTFPSSHWFLTKFVPKFTSWLAAADGPASELSRWRPTPETMLVPPAEYARLYRELRDKYGPALVESWTESTDPEKFVYEDIGIATFLILLFRRVAELEAEQGQAPANFTYKFVDLGCGNGLLCWLLAQEGFRGLGLDLQRRRIWDRFDADVELLETAVDPKYGLTYPSCEWILGNHSDELTPWIPLVAASSTPQACSSQVLKERFLFVNDDDTHVVWASRWAGSERQKTVDKQ